jgi:hypothetical protein
VEQTSTGYAGLHLLPNALLASAMSLSAGYLIKATGKYKTMLIVLTLLAILGPAMMVSWQRGRTNEVFYWFSMVPAGCAAHHRVEGPLTETRHQYRLWRHHCAPRLFPS